MKPVARKVILKMSLSADGFVGGPNGEIDWIFRGLDDGVTAWLVETLWLAGVHIMGSRTFQDMATYWPTSSEPFAAPMNEIPKIVFSRRTNATAPDKARTTTALKETTQRHSTQPEPAAETRPALVSWTGAALARSDLATEISDLKRRPGKDVLAHGGASFARNLAALGLIDEYRLLIHPVALGRGLPLFSGLPKPLDLSLISTTVFRSGVVAHVYRPNVTPGPASDK